MSDQYPVSSDKSYHLHIVYILTIVDLHLLQYEIYFYMFYQALHTHYPTTLQRFFSNMSLVDVGLKNLESFYMATLELNLLDVFHILHLTIRSEEHTSELQSRFDLVCRLLLEKKNYISLTLCLCHVMTLYST